MTQRGDAERTRRGNVGRWLGRLLPLLWCCLPAAADSDPFPLWLDGLRTEALAAGISAATLDGALADLAPLDRVIELDRNQPESKLTFGDYLERVVPRSRVTTGRRMLADHGPLLEQIGAHYGVQPRFIVALWGIESDFGRRQGGYAIVPALATLAFDGRRSDFFRGELLAALRILDQGHVALEAFVGSWAGALGQCQFMPSSFERHAVDHDGDGRRDIWHSPGDVFASIANYLAANGWQGAQIWGRPVRLPAGGPEPAGLEHRQPLSIWQARGVRRADGRDLPAAPDLPAALIRPGGDDGPAYLVYQNYETLLAWNRSLYFATAVGILADRIAWGPE